MSRNVLLLLCVSIPSFMISLDSNIVAVSLSSIGRSLHADFASIEWVISAYTLAFATLLLPAGALADRFGRKRMLLLGLSVFTVASGFCGAATSSVMLNVSRAIQGIGAAILLSAALAIMSHGFQGKARAKAFAFWGSVIGVSMMLGPVAGGLITQVLGWQWAFYINLPVGAAVIAMTIFSVDESKDPDAETIDILGVATFSGFLGILTWALIAGNREGWSSQATVVKLALSLAFLVAFVVVELKQTRPMADFSYLGRRTFIGACIANVAYAAAFLTMLTYLPFFFQSALGYPPLHAGLLMLPLAVPLFVVPRLVSSFLDHRYSGRVLLTLGLALVGVGLLITSMRIGSLSYGAIFLSMLLASAGAGILNGQTAKVSMTAIPVERAGMASGVSGTVRFSGIVIGFSALGAVLFQRLSSSLALGIPGTTPDDLSQIARLITDGNFTAATALIIAHRGSVQLARQSLASGYQGVIFTAAVVALCAAAAAWALISSSETAPHGTGSETAAAPEVLID